MKMHGRQQRWQEFIANIFYRRQLNPVSWDKCSQSNSLSCFFLFSFLVLNYTTNISLCKSTLQRTGRCCLLAFLSKRRITRKLNVNDEKFKCRKLKMLKISNNEKSKHRSVRMLKNEDAIIYLRWKIKYNGNKKIPSPCFSIAILSWQLIFAEVTKHQLSKIDGTKNEFIVTLHIYRLFRDLSRYIKMKGTS